MPLQVLHVAGQVGEQHLHLPAREFAAILRNSGLNAVIDLDIEGIPGGPVHAVFIRAPWVEEWETDVDVLASVEVAGTTRAVAVQQGRVLATSFHPEVTGDHSFHREFLRGL